MTARILEALFRNRWLLLAPVLIVPVVATVLTVRAPAPYESNAGIWAERSLYLNVTTDFSPYITPAQGQANRLNELLRSRTFFGDVIERTSLAPLLGSVEGRERLQGLLAEAIEVVPAGEHLVALRFRAETPELAVEGVNAVIAAFRTRTALDRTGQARTALVFYEARLVEADDRLTKANGALASYVAGNAALRAPSGLLSPAASLDPRFLELQRAADAAGLNADRVRALLNQSQLDVAATQAGQELGFRVVDPPERPTAPTRQLRKVLIYPAVAVVGGLALSAVLLLLLVLGDRTVRYASELPTQAGVIGVLPRLTPRGIAQASAPGAVRRAIGYVAGATLAIRRGARLQS